MNKLLWKEEYNETIGKMDKYIGNIEIANVTNLKLPKIVMGNIECYGHEELKSLEGFPEYVLGDVYVYHSGIETLKGAPKEIQGSFEIVGSKNLKTLKYAPKKVFKNVNISMCSSLEDISDLPDGCQQVFAARCYSLKELNLEGKTIKEFFGLPFCTNLKSLKGCPKVRHIDLTECNGLETLDGIDPSIEEITLTGLGHKKDLDITALLDFQNPPHIIIRELGELGKKIIQFNKNRTELLSKFDKKIKKELIREKKLRKLWKIYFRNEF